MRRMGKIDWHGHWQQSPLAQRWQTLAQREQHALLLLAGFLLLVLGYLALWQPAQRQVQAAREAFTEQRALHAYLQAHAPQVQPGSGSMQRVDPARLQGWVTSSAAEAGLQIERLESLGEGSVQLSLQAAPAEPLLAWLQALERQGEQVAEAALERREAGLVGARLTLQALP
ncbi:MAG: type II secretion system protein M [Gammaproteobacteria bacterium]|nr:type II secretion system protein M [Gammaproteobacteria bacterium]